ncbi:hypothetical protein SAMN05216565_110140 [Litchfieldia salsa]|uniref:DUF8042 domain-containing protein n=2 Tax=Litchfieldia salsa TaxID=930152 RepID=A0A1H0WDI3_9BACI|nr:hypothetical protein SAMN05216565_110140 [Litchfieldia salsa]
MFGSENMNLIINETVSSIKEYLPKVINATDDIAKLLQTDKEWEALNLIVAVTEGIEWCIEAVNKIQDLKGEVYIDTMEISKILMEINEALAVRDFVLTADLFEYELTPVLNTWLTKIGQIHS